MELEVFTDGGSIRNPGPAAASYVVCLNKKILLKYSEKVGVVSNNQAEYLALIAALKKVKELTKKNQGIKKIVFFSDSKLVVNQVNGFFKVKNPQIREKIMEIRILEQEINIPIIYKNIPREQNGLADSLIKKELAGIF